MDELFAPPDEAWHPISPTWKTLSRISLLIGVGVVFVAAAVLIGVISGIWWIAALVVAAGAVIVIIRSALIGRTYRSWGYALREEDLYIRHGWMFRTLVAVPYGRMQAVEVNSGPLERAFGLASVQLITASPASNAQIVGLPPDEAAQLRDLLTSKGENQASGL